MTATRAPADLSLTRVNTLATFAARLASKNILTFLFKDFDFRIPIYGNYGKANLNTCSNEEGRFVSTLMQNPCSVLTSVVQNLVDSNFVI
jgi:hypothetical protein